MTPEQRIDNNLDWILRAAGTSLKNYTMPSSLDKMRNAMREVMSDSYIQGSNDCYQAMLDSSKVLAANLQRYQDWRRGADERTMEEAGLNPDDIGKWLDAAIERLGGGR